MVEIRKVFYVPTVLPEHVGTATEDATVSDAVFSFGIDDGVLTLEAEMPDGSTEQLSLNINDNLGSAWDWVRLSTYDGHITNTEAVFHGFGQSSYQLRRNRAKLARIAIEPDGGIIIAFLVRCKQPCNDAEPITGENLAKLFCKNSGWMKEKYAAVREKAKFLRDVDSYDSLSYLEAQTDLLTRIISSMSDYLSDKTSLTESEAKSLFSALKVADANSVLDVKPLESVTAEFAKKKAGFRLKQKEYYNA